MLLFQFFQVMKVCVCFEKCIALQKGGRCSFSSANSQFLFHAQWYSHFSSNDVKSLTAMQTREATEAVTQQQSLAVVKNMVRTSVRTAKACQEVDQ